MMDLNLDYINTNEGSVADENNKDIYYHENVPKTLRDIDPRSLNNPEESYKLNLRIKDS